MPNLNPQATEFIVELHTNGPVIQKKFRVKDYKTMEACFNAAKTWTGAHINNSLLQWRIEDDVSIKPILESRQDFRERP